jgi:hypothetical protein
MTGTAQMLTIRIPLKVRKRGGRKTMIAPGVLAMPARVDIALVKALARAFRWRRMLEDGSYSTIKELAAAEKINASYLCRVLRLTLLAPDVVEAILDGRQPEGMTLPGFMKPLPAGWGERQALFGENDRTGWKQRSFGVDPNARRRGAAPDRHLRE